MSDRVSIDVSAGIADVRLNRPEKRNAMDLEMFTAICDAAASIRARSDIRVVILSGEGESFCSGIDTSIFGDDSAAQDGLLLFGRDESCVANRAQMPIYTWCELEVPVVAAIHGVAFGAGFQLAMAADIRCTRPDTLFSVMEIKWGLIPDMCGTQLLPPLVGLDVAKELAMTGRRVNGVEAHKLGLVTHVAEIPFEKAHEIAEEIASKNPHAIRAAKRLFNAAAKSSVTEGLAREATEQQALLFSPNQIEAVMAEIQKRPAHFADPS